MTCREIAELSPLYLSGELPLARLREFGLHLDECRSCALDVEQQRSLDARLRVALGYEAPDTTALDRSVMRQIRAASPSKHWPFIAAAAVLLLVTGSVWWIRRPAAISGLYTEAARDHQLEVVQHQPRRWRVRPDEVDALAARYGLPAGAVARLGPAGYRLEHAKICGLEGAPVLHLVYANGLREISLYVRRDASRLHSRLGEAVAGKEVLDGFQTNRLTAVVVTEGPRTDCVQFAQSAARAL